MSCEEATTWWSRCGVLTASRTRRGYGVCPHLDEWNAHHQRSITPVTIRLSDWWRNCQRGSGPTSIPELLVDWIENIIDDMAETMAKLEDDLTKAESGIDTEEPALTRQTIVAIRKRALTLRRYMAPQREALTRLSTETPTWLDEYFRVRLRDITDRLIRYIEDLDEIRDRAILAQEELAARLADEMNRKTYVFTIVAVVFLPLGFLTGLLGVNVGGVPGLDEPQAFNYLVFLCCAISVGLLGYFKWRRWM